MNSFSFPPAVAHVFGTAGRSVVLSLPHPQMWGINDLIRLHFADYGRAMSALSQEVAVLLAAQGVRPGRASWQPLEHISITAVLRNPKPFDADGKHGAVKMLIDVLKLPHPKNNPHGLGVIVDDTDGEHGAHGLVKELLIAQRVGPPHLLLEVREWL